MPTYSYTAYSTTHERLTGTLTATSTDEAVNRLAVQKLTVISLAETSEEVGLKTNKTLSLEDKIFLMQNLATFLKSGIPIAEALTTTADDSQSKRLKELLHQVAYDVKAGQTMAVSLSQFSESFDPALIALVEAGEESGKLDVIFENLTQKFRQDRETISRVRSALIYPAVVGISLFGLGIVLVFFALPRITSVFEKFAIDLPIITKLLISFSKIVNSNQLVSFTLLILAIILIIILTSLKKTRSWFVVAARLVPGLKKIVNLLDFERFTATLSILLKAGVPIQHALDVAGRAVSQRVLAQKIPEAAQKVSEGKRLADALTDTSLPKVALSLIAAGERSGNLAENLESLKNYYQDQLDESLKNFTALIEPILTLIVGVVIGVVVISIIAPIYQLIGQLNLGS